MQYDFDEDYDSDEENRFRRGRNYYIDDYLSKMTMATPGVATSPYEEGKYCNTEKLKIMFIKQYDTKVVLCGDYIRVITYTSSREAMKYNAKTGKVNKFYEDNSANKIDKTVNLAYANAETFKTYITLSFKKNVGYDEAINSLNAWIGTVKYAHKGFKYIRVIGRGRKSKRIHFHLLTSLDVDMDTAMFVKAKVKKPNVYNLTNWKKYGFSKVNKIIAPKDLTYIATYIGTHNYRKKDFPGQRIMSKSNGLIKPKVFYYDSSVDQKKIDILIKDAIEMSNYQYEDYYGSLTEGKIYKRYAVSTDAFAYPNHNKKYKKAEGIYGIDRFANANLDEEINVVNFEEGHQATETVLINNTSVAVYIKIQTKDYRRLAIDLAQLMDYCESNGYEAEYFIDYGYTGASANRPNFKRMMSKMKKKKFSKIIAISINKIAITPYEFNLFREDLIQYGCELQTLIENKTTQLLVQQGITFNDDSSAMEVN